MKKKSGSDRSQKQMNLFREAYDNCTLHNPRWSNDMFT